MTQVFAAAGERIEIPRPAYRVVVANDQSLEIQFFLVSREITFDSALRIVSMYLGSLILEVQQRPKLETGV